MRPRECGYCGVPLARSDGEIRCLACGAPFLVDGQVARCVADRIDVTNHASGPDTEYIDNTHLVIVDGRGDGQP